MNTLRVSLHADFLDPDFWTRRLSLVGTFEKFLEWSLQADSTKVRNLDLTPGLSIVRLHQRSEPWPPLSAADLLSLGFYNIVQIDNVPN